MEHFAKRLGIGRREGQVLISPAVTSRQIIHFAHANGFPAKTYSKLFSFLEPRFELQYIDRHGHNPNFPVADGWFSLRDELRREIEAKFVRPVIGVGHSLGGILHLLAAVVKPRLYKQIILLDAPIISRFSSHGVRILKATNLMDRFSPSRLTKTRRNFWATKIEAYEHFKSKAKFAAFDDEVLRDYIQFGTVEMPDGIHLLFEPEIEAAIYRSLPHHLPLLAGKLTVPTAYVGGDNSREARLARLGFMQRNFPIEFRFLAGSHLFPFEIPQKTAEAIISLVK